MGACGEIAFTAACASIPAEIARNPGYETPSTPTFPLLFGTFFSSQSTVSLVSVVSSTSFFVLCATIGRFITNCPSDAYLPRISPKTKMYPLAANSGLLMFTLFDELRSTPYGVRSIKNGSGSPALSDPTGRRITTCSFTPSRIGIIASLRVYSLDGAFCAASCAPIAFTETSRQIERNTLQQLRIFMRLDLKSNSNRLNPSTHETAGAP